MGCGASSPSPEPVAKPRQQHRPKPSNKPPPDVLSLDPNVPSSKRITKEAERMRKNPIPGITVEKNPNNPRHFKLSVLGAEGSCFENGLFRMELFLPMEYPMSPPKIHFLTRIYHPNIDRVGRICLDILKDKWSPALQIDKVCLSIQLLLQTPNPADPLDPQIAKVWTDTPKLAEERAREWTKLYADKDRPDYGFV